MIRLSIISGTCRSGPNLVRTRSGKSILVLNYLLSYSISFPSKSDKFGKPYLILLISILFSFLVNQISLVNLS